MLRLLLLTMISFGLLWSGPTSAAERPTKASTTGAEHSVTTDLTYKTIYVYPSGQAQPGTPEAAQFPPQTTLTVAVKDAQGRPAAGVPVTFEVAQNSMLQGLLDITPQQTTTGADGKVVATIEPAPGASTGSGDILVRVADMTQAVGLTVDTSKIRAR